MKLALNANLKMFDGNPIKESDIRGNNTKRDLLVGRLLLNILTGRQTKGADGMIEFNLGLRIAECRSEKDGVETWGDFEMDKTTRDLLDKIVSEAEDPIILRCQLLKMLKPPKPNGEAK